MTVLTNAEGREWRDSVLAKSALYRKLLAERSQAIKSGMPTPALHCVNAHSKVAAVAGVRVHHAGCNTGVERKPPSRSGRRNSKVSVYSGRSNPSSWCAMCDFLTFVNFGSSSDFVNSLISRLIVNTPRVRQNKEGKSNDDDTRNRQWNRGNSRTV